jgi:hypothetical protein
MTAAPVGSTELALTSRLKTPSRRDMLVVLAMGLAVVLGVAALFGPWFAVVTRTNFSNTAATDDRGYGLFGYSAVDRVSSMSATIGGNYLLWPSVRSALLVVQIVSALDIVVGVSAVCVTIFGILRPRPSRLPVLLSLGTAVLAVVGPVVFAVTFPSAAHADGLFDFGASFLGSTSSGNSSSIAGRTWGPGWAWYGFLVTGASFLIASLVALPAAARRASRPSS